ncbi:MAG: phenylalanine--tRNA ligase beta subunit-related protein [Euryarchaeota archaeon]|nr:phenylalanine--tRNA ligase beta subunit-related protein [Euryarchaeota archaeon]
MRLVIEDAVRKKFGISVGVAAIRGVRQKESSEISKAITEVEEAAKHKYNINEVKNIRIIRLQRDFFWRMGVDPTKVRPASEALLRRILLNKGLPRVSPIVDAYNLASVQTLLTFSAFDMTRITPPLSVRFSRASEEVTLIGNRRKKLTGKEIVLTDSAKILCVYAHGDVDETKVTDSTTDLLLVTYGIPGLSHEELKEGALVALEYIKKFAGGESMLEEVYV